MLVGGGVGGGGGWEWECLAFWIDFSMLVNNNHALATNMVAVQGKRKNTKLQWMKGCFNV